MTLVSAKWSVTEYHRMVEAGLLDDRQVELLGGEIIEMSPEGLEHTYHCDDIAEYLRAALRGLAKVREAHPITLPTGSEPEPDVAIVRLPADRYRTQQPQPADIYWLIEVANTTLEKDLGIKKDLYAAAGIVEYWVVDQRNAELVVFRDLEADGYRSQVCYRHGLIAPLAFGDVELDVLRFLS
jgi:Uma2 family endonuclease